MRSAAGAMPWGNRPRAGVAHPARCNGNRSPGPMRSAASAMPRGTGRGPALLTRPDAQGNGPRSLGAMEREPFTLPDAIGRGSDALGNRPRAGACSPCPMQREPFTRPDATGRGPRLLTLPDAMGTTHPARCNRPRVHCPGNGRGPALAHPARCPGERAALDLRDGTGTAHPARCDRPRVRCPGGTGRGPALLTRPDATGTVHPARCDRPRVRCPGEPAAGRRLLTPPDAQGNGPRSTWRDGTGTVHPARCDRPRVRCPGEPAAGRRLLTPPDAQGNGPRSLARWNGNRSPCPMRSAAGPMPWGTGRGPALAHPARCNGNRSPGPMQPAAGRRLLTLPDAMGTTHPARCNRPRVHCPGNGRGPAFAHPARCPGERAALDLARWNGNRSPGPMRSAAGAMPWGNRPRAGACSPGPMQREPFTRPDAIGRGYDAQGNRPRAGACSPCPMPRGTGRAHLRDGTGTVHPARCDRPRGTIHPARCDRPRVRCPGQPAALTRPREPFTRPDATGRGPALDSPCPMQWEPLTRPDAIGRGCNAQGTGAGRRVAHPARCPGERAVLTLRDGTGTAHPARCDRPRVRCPGEPAAGRRLLTRPDAIGRGCDAQGNRPRAGACSPYPMQSAGQPASNSYSYLLGTIPGRIPLFLVSYLTIARKK